MIPVKDILILFACFALMLWGVRSGNEFATAFGFGGVGGACIWIAFTFGAYDGIDDTILCSEPIDQGDSRGDAGQGVDPSKLGS